MTIDSAYFPEKYLNDGGTEYRFGFEVIEGSYVYVYGVNDSGYELISTSDYSVELNAYRAPISKGGTVTLNTPLGDEYDAIAILRFTEITNDQTFTAFTEFSPESFEFQADKLTMILQEIEGHICDCRSTPAQECDEFSETALTDYMGIYFGANGSANLWILDESSGVSSFQDYFNIQDIDAYSTTSTSSMLNDGRSASTIGSSKGSSLNSNAELLIDGGLIGSFGFIFDPSGTASMTIMDLRWGASSATGQIRAGFDGTDGLSIVLTAGGDTVALSFLSAFSGSGICGLGGHFILITYDVRPKTLLNVTDVYLNVYIDGEPVYSEPALFSVDGAWTPFGSPKPGLGGSGGTGSAGKAQYAMTFNYQLADAAVAGLWEAMTQTCIDFIDTSTVCIPE